MHTQYTLLKSATQTGFLLEKNLRRGKKDNGLLFSKQ